MTMFQQRRSKKKCLEIRKLIAKEKKQTSRSVAALPCLLKCVHNPIISGVEIAGVRRSGRTTRKNTGTVRTKLISRNVVREQFVSVFLPGFL